jgi:hypothetical protein
VARCMLKRAIVACMTTDSVAQLDKAVECKRFRNRVSTPAAILFSDLQHSVQNQVPEMDLGPERLRFMETHKRLNVIRSVCSSHEGKIAANECGCI